MTITVPYGGYITAGLAVYDRFKNYDERETQRERDKDLTIWQRRGQLPFGLRGDALRGYANQYGVSARGTFQKPGGAQPAQPARDPIGPGTVWYGAMAGDVTQIRGPKTPRKRITGAYGGTQGGLPRDKNGEIDLKKLPKFARRFAKLINKSPGAYFAIMLAEWLYQMIYDPDAEARAEALAEAERIAEEAEAAEREAEADLEEQDKTERASANAKLRDVAIATGVKAVGEQWEKEYQGMVRQREADRGAEARAAERREAFQKSVLDAEAARIKQIQANRMKLAIGALGIFVPPLIQAGLGSKKQPSQSVSVNVPPGDFNIPEPPPFNLGYVQGLTPIEGTQLGLNQQTDPDLVCYRKSERKKRRKPKGRRICYTRTN